MVKRKDSRKKRKKGEKQEKWIGSAIKKPGALSKQLDIPEEKNIPKTLLKKIVKTRIGETIRNPTKTGKKRFRVTRLLKQRANLALNLKIISEQRHKD